ncbi:MAG: hypothetical protein JOS17DRAFT_500981 [Linnemannia elongata]|nr:MAG: hypothetical protein JOS17DRAFT_500981 [Linnemannia elongata]
MGSSTRHTPPLHESTIYSPTLHLPPLPPDRPIGASASPLSDLSAGANTAAASNGSSSGPTTAVAPPSAKSRKNPIESKAQKPSFLSLIFCCGANFVNDSDASALQVGQQSRPPTVSTGRAAGKKAVAGQLADEKPPQAQPTLVDITATTVLEDPVGVSCSFQPQEAFYQWTLYFHFTTMDQGQGSPCIALHHWLSLNSSSSQLQTDMYIAFRCEPRHILGDTELEQEDSTKKKQEKKSGKRKPQAQGGIPDIWACSSKHHTHHQPLDRLYSWIMHSALQDHIHSIPGSHPAFLEARVFHSISYKWT